MFRVPSLFRASPEFRPEWGLPNPDTQVALTISGKICWPNCGDAMELDAPLLRQFPQHELATTTDWPNLKGPQHFQGVAIIDLLLAAGWRGNHITVEGADGYSADAFLPELKRSNAIVATEWNGMPMPCTKFAPLWLVFPYDDAETQMERWSQRRLSVWKLTNIHID